MSTQHELVGKLVDDWAGGIIYRIESVNPGAFPAEDELVLKPEHIKPRTRFMPSDMARTPESVANLLAGRGRHSIAWAKTMPHIGESVLAELRNP